MLQGVVDEVHQDLSEGLGIGMGFDRGIGQLDFEGDVAFLGGGLQGLDDGGDVLRQVEAGGFEFGTAAFETGMAEDVVDEQTEAAGFAQDETVVFLAAWSVFGGQVDEFLGEQAHGGERGAQFVGDGGDEFGLLQRELTLAFRRAQGGKESTDGGEGGEGDQGGEDPGLAALACVQNFGMGESQGDGQGGEGGGGRSGERFAFG